MALDHFVPISMKIDLSMRKVSTYRIDRTLVLLIMVRKYVVEKAVSGICVILTVGRQSGYARSSLAQGLNFEGPDDHQHWRWRRLIVRLVMSLI